MAKQLTTNDVERAQILLTTKDGQHLLGVCKDKITIGIIAAYCKFVPVKSELIEQIPITDLMVGNDEDN